VSDPRPREEGPQFDWADVYRATFPELVRYLHRKVWDADRAQDLAMEAFVRAMGHEAPDNPRAWLFRVAANLARDEARLVLRRKRHLALLRTETEHQERSEPSPAEALEAADRMESVRRALEQLSERDQEVLLLWDAGFDYREIAEQTGLAVGAIGTTLSRARQRLVNSHAALEKRNAAR
jgi:RNA polymerase sigma-70 factor, ECF subfamily